MLEQILAPRAAEAAAAEIERTARAGARIVLQGRPGYPHPLLPLAEMPLVLYARGRVPECFDSTGVEEGAPVPAVAVVGSRHPTPYGSRQARRLAGGLVRRGFCVVSGLARGIDAEAHAAALEQGGFTVAVLGSGLGRMYPPDHEDLARRIVESGQGALLTEFPISSTPMSFHFPMRNRILSGLSEAVLVVEAGEKSGSLITVRHALDQGKAVYVVPGRIGPEAMGCLRLLAEGAAVALEPEDILPSVVPAVLPSAPGPAGVASIARESEGRAGTGPSPMGAGLRALFEQEDAWHPDDMAERLQVPLPDLLAELSRLELDGTLRRLPGGWYARIR